MSDAVVMTEAERRRVLAALKGNCGHGAEGQAMSDAAALRTVEIIVPCGYESADALLTDCGFERAARPPLASTPAMRARIRELAKSRRDDFDRAVIVLLDDLERLVKRYDL